MEYNLSENCVYPPMVLLMGEMMIDQGGERYHICRQTQMLPELRHQ